MMGGNDTGNREKGGKGQALCNEFIKLVCIKWNTGCQMVNHGSTTDHKRN